MGIFTPHGARDLVLVFVAFACASGMNLNGSVGSCRGARTHFHVQCERYFAAFLVTFIHEAVFIFPFCLSGTKTGLYWGWKLQGLAGAQTEGKTLS